MGHEYHECLQKTREGVRYVVVVWDSPFVCGMHCVPWFLWVRSEENMCILGVYLKPCWHSGFVSWAREESEASQCVGIMHIVTYI